MTETRGWGLLQFVSALNPPIAGLSTRGFPYMSSSRRKLQLIASVGLLLLFALVGVGCHGFFVDPILQTITVGPTGVGILSGKTQQMTAIGTYDDGTQKNITGSTSTTWTTSDATVASVSSAGLVTGAGAGTANITATNGVATGSASITVSLTGVTSITVSPSSQTVSVAAGIPFCVQAIATPSGTDISSTATWNFTAVAGGGAVRGITKTTATGCTFGQGQAFSVTGVTPVTVNVTASAPGTNGTVTSTNLVTVSITP
jgi:trimeric autotransporter adhesin